MINILNTIKQAIKETIEEIGMANFRRTSFFASNQTKYSDYCPDYDNVTQVEKNIYTDGKEFFFSDETGDLAGPYESVDQARTKLKEYCHWLETGEVV
jgi:hypothetical protein